jgi:glycosyltransferase involved in cell wall biosynthesis
VHPITELADYMRAADALVQGSLEEGLGLSPLEALACEVPWSPPMSVAWRRISATTQCSPHAAT